MKSLIKSSSAMIEALGKDCAEVRKLDPLRKRRNETKAFRRKLLKKFGMTCGYCNQSRASLKLEAAHIVPLEIGGQTHEENLIILCSQCHRAYDSGYCSINHMVQAARDWRGGHLNGYRPALQETIVRFEPIRDMPPTSVSDVISQIGAFQVVRKYAKGSHLIQQHLASLPADDPGKTSLLIKFAELTRRRSAVGVLGRAQHLLEGIDPAEMSSELKAQYFYELGYVYLLLGRHGDAGQMMQKSARAAKDRSAGQFGVDFVAASANQALCELATHDQLTIEKAIHLVARMKRLRDIARNSRTYWGARWALNCECHILQIYMKAKQSDKVWIRLERVRTCYFNSDLENGWDIAARQTITLLEGLVRVLFPGNKDQIDIGVELLARAFVTRLGRRQRPEGIRDAGFELALGLRRKNTRHLLRIADLLDMVLNITVDGTSVLWPWRAI